MRINEGKHGPPKRLLVGFVAFPSAGKIQDTESRRNDRHGHTQSKMYLNPPSVNLWLTEARTNRNLASRNTYFTSGTLWRLSSFVRM